MGSNKPVGTDPAELTMAGLQKDFWAKYQRKQITLDHFRWLLRISKVERDRLAASASATEGKFMLWSTFPFTVSTDFVHETQIGSFLELCQPQSSYTNDHITDANFAKATHRLFPGRHYMIKIFRIIRWVTSEECLNLYKASNGIFTSAHGLTLVWQKAMGTIPVSSWLNSFDKKDSLPAPDSVSCVPCIIRHPSDCYELRLEDFNSNWHTGRYILVFCDCNESA